MKKIQLIYGMIFLFVLGTAQNEENPIFLLESKVDKVHILPDSIIHPEYSLEENLRAYNHKDTISKADTIYGFGENSIFLHQKIQSEFLYFDPLVGKNLSVIKPDVEGSSKHLKKISFVHMFIYIIISFWFIMRAAVFIQDSNMRISIYLFGFLIMVTLVSYGINESSFPRAESIGLFISLLVGALFPLYTVSLFIKKISLLKARYSIITSAGIIFFGWYLYFKTPIFFISSIIGFALAFIVLGIQKYIKNKKFEDAPSIEKNADQGPGFGY